MIWRLSWVFLFSALAMAAVRSDKFLPEGEAMERLLAIEFHRKTQDPFLRLALTHHSKKVVKKAILVHGRIGDPASLDLLIPFLSHGNKDYKTLAAFSLSLIGGISHWPCYPNTRSWIGTLKRGANFGRLLEDWETKKL